MFRNRIINGDMRINQRAFNQAITGSSLYTLDRWFYDYVGGSTCTISQSTSVVPTSFYSSLASVFTTSSSGNYGGLYQYIEGYNLIDFNWGTSYGSPFTVSFWIYMSITGTMPICVDYYGSTSTVSYYTSFSVNAVNTWQYVTITIPPPPSSAGVFSTASLINKIAAIKFMHTTSTNVNGTVTNNTWSTTINANNSIALSLGSSSWTRYFTGIQLEKGTIATPFEFRPYQIELQLCQRYCMAWSGGYIGTVFGNGSSSYAPAKSITMIPLQVPMRSTPNTVVGSLGYDWSSYAAGALGNLIFFCATPTMVSLASTTSIQQGYTSAALISSSVFYVSAEL
jgi:hypothetical protein